VKLNFEQIAQVTRRFLDSTPDRGRFDEFFKTCLALTSGYLQLLIHMGHHLPLDEYAGKSPHNDLAVDCLATLFASTPGRPYYLIREYLGSKIGDLTPAVEIVALLQGMIKKHTRQELSKMAADRNQQAANIRRTVRRVMENGDYEAGTFDTVAVWSLRGTKDCRRGGQPLVDDATLHGWIAEAVHTHSQMPERCRAVFNMLDRDDRFINCIEQNRLIAGFNAVLTDGQDYRPSPDGEPRGAFVHGIGEECARQAATATISGVIARLGAERGYSDELLSGYQRALSNLLEDMSWHGCHDPLPQYLREALPSLDSRSYLKTHKYVWETGVAECLKMLRQLLLERGLKPEFEGK